MSIPIRRVYNAEERELIKTGKVGKAKQLWTARYYARRRSGSVAPVPRVEPEASSSASGLHQGTPLSPGVEPQ
jgi:hypothetical protein